MRSIYGFTSVCLSAAILCACTANSATSSVPSSLPSLNPSWVNLYVANGGNSTVTVYKPRSNEPQRSITQGVFNLFAIAFDRVGDLYVLNGCNRYPGHRNGTVSVYGPGAKSVLRTITNRITCPFAMALDAAGNLYVANEKPTCSGAVCSSTYNALVYAAGSTSLIRTISQGISTPLALAFDSMGNLYVANGGYRRNPGSVTVYASGSSSMLRTITNGIAYPKLLAFDNGGNLYVTNGGYSPGITVYAPGSDSVLRSIPTEYAGYAQALAFDRAGNLYVAASYGSLPQKCFSVAVYASGSASLLRSISQGLCVPRGLALDDAGNLYVGNLVPTGTSSSRSNVLVYAPGSTSVLRRISRGIDNPIDLKFGP